MRVSAGIIENLDQFWRILRLFLLPSSQDGLFIEEGLVLETLDLGGSWVE
ncbi:hypothetical protein [Helicobacter felis]|nr:hypothetical protein [Helicobacter felis]